MRQLLLGIDIGTSACKVAVFDVDGKVVASATGSYPVYYPRPGWAEQNPEEWWSTVCIVIKHMLHDNAIDATQIAGIGIDGQSWSAIAVEEEGNVLTNTPIWMDTRAQDICDQLNERIGKERIFEVAGNSLQPSYTTAKILWYKEQMPEVYARIHKMLQSNAFIAFRLTGKYSHDVSQGYGIHCFDMRTATWRKELCEEMGIPFSFLPELYACHEIVGTVTERAAQASGLAVGTPVVAGGLDAACGTLGAGVLHAGETQEQGGQAGGMSICMEEYAADPRLILGYHVVPNKWLLQGGTTGGGGVMRWLEEEFGEYERSIANDIGKSSLQQFNELAEQVKPGSDGVIFLPYMAGERSPIWDRNAKGVYYGLDFSKTKGHMIRAALEGVAFSLKHNLDIAQEVGANTKELWAMGGSANSLLWTQIKSDITGKPIAVPSSDTATTLGAAILAGVGVGVYKNFEEAVQKTVAVSRRHEPNWEAHKRYAENYDTYLSLYESIKWIMKKNGGHER